MLKVVHLTSVHPVFDIRIFYKECRTLFDAGYEVVLVVQHDRDEFIDGVRIKSVPHAKNRWIRRTRTLWQVYRMALKEKADVYHLHDPELLPIGCLLSFQGIRVIYDVHEDVPRQVMSNPSIPILLQKPLSIFAEAFEWVGSFFFKSIVVATHTIGDRFPNKKTVLVQNFPTQNELKINSSLPYSERPLNISYTGVISKNRGIKEMVNAMALLPKSLNAHLILAGKFSPAQLEKDIQQLRAWDRIDYIGWQDRRQIATLLGKSRIGLVLLHPKVNYLDSYPVKLFEYMLAGIPVIVSDFPLWRKIVSKARCGLTVNPLDAKAIAGAIEYLLAHPVEAEVMGRRGQEAVKNYYNWEAEQIKLLHLYKQIFANRSMQ